MAVTQAVNQKNLGHKVTSREIVLIDLAMRAWGSEYRTPDPGTYQFSNGRKFDSTDTTTNGFYVK